MADYLLHEFRGNFLLDVRDFTYEQFPPYRAAVAALARRAGMCAISSGGFRRFLPRDARLVLNHNVTWFDSADSVAPPAFEAERPINIGWVGYLRYPKLYAWIIESLSSDNRFMLTFAGGQRPGCDVADIAAKLNCRNVCITGKYDNREKPAIYTGIDIANCFFGNDSPVVSLALPNKLYDAAMMGRPVLAPSGTYLGKVVERYGLGLCAEPFERSLAEKLWNYTRRFDSGDFSRNTKRFLRKVHDDEDVFLAELRRCLV